MGMIIEVNYQQDRVEKMIEWLHDNVQENAYPDFGKYNFSTISQFAEWRSRDTVSWIVRVYGQPAKVSISIEDEKLRMMFMLRWT
jgi:hypothetical protein